MSLRGNARHSDPGALQRAVGLGFRERSDTMPTLFKTRRTTDTETVESERPTIDVSNIELPKVEVPKVELPKVELPKVELPEIAIPKVDVGKAVLGVATAAGLVKRRRSRWPYLLGVGVVIAVAAWAVTNAAVRERLSQAMTAISERMQAMRGGGGQDQDP